jgi:hypothetical protein
MKKYWIFLFLLTGGKLCYGQKVVFDRDHLRIVNENGFVRISSELAMQRIVDQMNKSLHEIKINNRALLLTQDLIYRALTEVDQGLKTALAVKELSALIGEIFSDSEEMMRFATAHPQLLLFAEQFSIRLKERSIRLVHEVSAVALNSREDLLLDFQKRDALIKKISLELKLIRALVFSMHKSMYWAAQRSFIAQVNPFKDFINIDKRLARQIILNAKTLNK